MKHQLFIFSKSLEFKNKKCFRKLIDVIRIFWTAISINVIIIKEKCQVEIWKINVLQYEFMLCNTFSIYFLRICFLINKWLSQIREYTIYMITCPIFSSHCSLRQKGFTIPTYRKFVRHTSLMIRLLWAPCV